MAQNRGTPISAHDLCELGNQVADVLRMQAQIAHVLEQYGMPQNADLTEMRVWLTEQMQELQRRRQNRDGQYTEALGVLLQKYRLPPLDAGPANVLNGVEAVMRSWGFMQRLLRHLNKDDILDLLRDGPDADNWGLYAFIESVDDVDEFPQRANTNE